MVSTPKDNITTIHALLGLPDNATLEQVFAPFDEAKKNANKNPWHIKEVECLLLDIDPDGRAANIHDLLSSQSTANNSPPLPTRCTARGQRNCHGANRKGFASCSQSWNQAAALCNAVN